MFFGCFEPWSFCLLYLYLFEYMNIHMAKTIQKHICSYELLLSWKQYSQLFRTYIIISWITRNLIADFENTFLFYFRIAYCYIAYQIKLSNSISYIRSYSRAYQIFKSQLRLAIDHLGRCDRCIFVLITKSKIKEGCRKSLLRDGYCCFVCFVITFIS